MKIKQILKQIVRPLWREDIDLLNKKIESKDNLIKEKDKIISKLKSTDPLEEYYNSKYPKKELSYSGRYIPGYGKYSVDVRDFFVNPNSKELQEIVKPWLNLSDDEKAYKCQEYVFSNIRYTSDKSNYGLPEYWAYPQETLKTKKGDCDDGAILIANLMLASGIPYWKIRINAGNVYNYQAKPLGGHAWCNYYYEKGNRWVSMDWCFYPNLMELSERPDYKDEMIYGYGSVWFSFNKKYAFSKT